MKIRRGLNPKPTVNVEPEALHLSPGGLWGLRVRTQRCWPCFKFRRHPIGPHCSLLPHLRPCSIDPPRLTPVSEDRSTSNSKSNSNSNSNGNGNGSSSMGTSLLTWMGLVWSPQGHKDSNFRKFPSASALVPASIPASASQPSCTG